MTLTRIQLRIGAIVFLACSAATAHAAELFVENSSFESPTLADGAFLFSVAGWQVNGNAGVQNPLPSVLSNLPHGEQSAFLGSGLFSTIVDGSISQAVASGLEANRRYRLTVDVGRRADDIGLSDFVAELLAGDTVLTSATILERDLAAGQFQNLALSYDSGSALASPLSIRFRSVFNPTLGGAYRQVNFDNVRFDVTPLSVAAVPEPATWAIMIGGFGMVGTAMRGKRAKKRELLLTA